MFIVQSQIFYSECARRKVILSFPKLNTQGKRRNNRFQEGSSMCTKSCGQKHKTTQNKTTTKNHFNYLRRMFLSNWIKDICLLLKSDFYKKLFKNKFSASSHKIAQRGFLAWPYKTHQTREPERRHLACCIRKHST